MTRPGPSGWIKPILTLAIAILIGGCCVIGAREIVVRARQGQQAHAAVGSARGLGPAYLQPVFACVFPQGAGAGEQPFAP